MPKGVGREQQRQQCGREDHRPGDATDGDALALSLHPALTGDADHHRQQRQGQQLDGTAAGDQDDEACERCAADHQERSYEPQTERQDHHDQGGRTQQRAPKAPRHRGFAGGLAQRYAVGTEFDRWVGADICDGFGERGDQGRGIAIGAQLEEEGTAVGGSQISGRARLGPTKRSPQTDAHITEQA